MILTVNLVLNFCKYDKILSDKPECMKYFIYETSYMHILHIWNFFIDLYLGRYIIFWSVNTNKYVINYFSKFNLIHFFDIEFEAKFHKKV